MPNENKTFWGRQTYIGIPLRVEDQTHLSPDGQYYDCRPQPKGESSLPSVDTPIKETGLVLKPWEATMKQAIVLLECFSCALLQQTADGQYICGSSGQELVPVEEAK